MTPTPPPARCEPPEGWKDKDGMHWLKFGESREFQEYWCGFSHMWISKYGKTHNPEFLHQRGFRYLAPVHTPDEIAAMLAAARREGAEEMRERAVKVTLDEQHDAGLPVLIPLEERRALRIALTRAVSTAIRALPLPGDDTP